MLNLLEDRADPRYLTTRPELPLLRRASTLGLVEKLKIVA